MNLIWLLALIKDLYLNDVCLCVKLKHTSNLFCFLKEIGLYAQILLTILISIDIQHNGGGEGGEPM